MSTLRPATPREVSQSEMQTGTADASPVSRIDTLSLSANFFSQVGRINVKDMELRDIFRGLAIEYEVNLLVDNSLTQRVTITLSNITVLNCILYLSELYELDIRQIGEALRIRPTPSEAQAIRTDNLNIVIDGGLLSLDVRNQEIRNVMRKISDLAGINIVLRQGVQGEISGYLQELTIDDALRILVETNGFRLRRRNNVYYVSAMPQVTDDRRDRSMWIDVYDGLIDFDLENAEIGAVLQEIAQQYQVNLVTYGTPNGRVTAKCSGLTFDGAMNYLFRGTGFSYKREGEVYIVGDKGSGGLVTSKLVRLEHIRSEGILDVLPDVIRRDATIKVITEQNAIMVIGTNDVIHELELFIAQIDHPTPQILIEALVVDYSSTDIRELGVMLGTNDVQSDSTRWQNYSLLDIGVNQNGSFYAQHDGPSLNDNLRDLSDWMGVANLGRLPDNFYMKLRALESEGKANVRSRPQVATLNGHPASISVGTTQYYILKTTTPVTSTSDVVTQESERFEQIEANVTLSIIPWVSASGEVTVEIHPEFRTPVGTLSSSTPPTINTRVLDSTVRLRDGETIILGGLIQETDSRNEYKVPILADIPFLGKLFRTKQKNNSKTELMIYITPYVFYGDEVENSRWNYLREQFDVGE